MITKKEKVRKREFRQSLFFSILIGTFLLGAVSFLVISNLRINQKRAELIDRIENLRTEIQALEGKNQQLKAGLIQTESEIYWEGKAREQGYKKPGEEAIVVLPPEDKGQESIGEEKSFVEKILDWFRRD